MSSPHPDSDLPEPPVPAGFGPAPVSQFVLTIGDIGITTDGLVVTPNGTAPLRSTRWIALDQSMTTRTIPSYAIVLAVVFALFCLLGLLFLLIKEDRTTGYVLVSVSGDHLQHSTQIPVTSPFAVAQVRQLVAQAQSMAASAV